VPITTSTPRFPLYLRSWNVPDSCSFPSSDDWEGAPISHAYMSHYGDLSLRKVTIRHQLVVPSTSSNDDLPLVKHDARVDLNPGSARIRYIQEPALISDSPPSSMSPYIVLGQWVGVGQVKVLIPNPSIKGKAAPSRPHQTRHRGCSEVLLLQRSVVRPK
jgi:hypothetical protein